METSTPKTVVCCQIQINRLSFMSEQDVVDFCELFKKGWPESVSYKTGDDEGRYVNLFLETSDRVDRAELWDRVHRSMIKSKMPGGEFRDAMIVTMTGENGWDDYLLLHHFDRTQPLDTLG